ncbi:MAG: exodeoxyribonuclease VII small subunit [Nitrospira sp.]|nr:exodeoxyribonuclease VII small subunit [Nitrospira sp.]
MAGVKFEQAMARLEVIVAELEKGDLPLDESLKIFEEGIRLSKNCLKVLEEAERKIEVLVQDKNGKKQLRAFSPVDEETGEVDS